MNVGIVTTWFERGGAYVSRQYEKILQQKHRVFIYARGGEIYAKGNSIWDKENVTWDPKQYYSPLLSSWLDLVSFKNWCKNKNLDIVFFNEQSWFDPIILCKKMGIKTGAYIDRYLESTIPFFEIYDFLICNTKRHLSAFTWHPQSYYVPWGTEVELFKPKSYDPVEKGKVTFFHNVGMDPIRKNTELLLKAFTKLNGPAKLIIHTQVDLKSRLPHSLKLMGTLLDKGMLTIIHKTVPAPGLYPLGDVYVYPSQLDGIGLSIAEALSSGLPVITSNHPPMNEFVKNTNGKLIKIDYEFAGDYLWYWTQCKVNFQSLIENMQSYIDQYNDLSIFKKQAREYAVKNLNWFENAKNLPEIFENAINYSYNEKREIIQNILTYESNKLPFFIKLHKKSPILGRMGKWIYDFIKSKIS